MNKQGSLQPPTPPAVQENIVNLLDEYHQTAKCHIKNGLTSDELGDKQLAVKHYLNALQCLEKATSIETSGLSNDLLAATQLKLSQIYSLLQKVRSRLYELEHNRADSFDSGPSQPIPTAPSASELDSDSSSTQPSLHESLSASIVELLYIPGGVQLFSVDDNMKVTAAPPTYPTFLRVCSFEDKEGQSSSRPPAFIEVGEWVYPLVPGNSPVLHCTNGAYIFPNITTTQSASNIESVGLVLSSNLDPMYEEMFASMLSNMANLQEQSHGIDNGSTVDLRKLVPYPSYQSQKLRQKPRGSSTSDKIAHGLETSANWLSWGLAKGAEVTTSLVNRGADTLQRNIKPNEQPTLVHPTVERGLRYTHQATKTTVHVSSFLVNSLCAVTGKVAKSVSPHIKSLLSSEPVQQASTTTTAVEDDKPKETKTDAAMKVASAGLYGFGAVWSSMEKAGLAIAQSFSKATVDTVQHKYGPDAGKSTKYAMDSAVNCCRTAFNVDNLGVKAVAKRAAKDTGKAVIESYNEKSSDSSTSLDRGSQKSHDLSNEESQSSKKPERGARYS